MRQHHALGKRGRARGVLDQQYVVGRHGAQGGVELDIVDRLAGTQEVLPRLRAREAARAQHHDAAQQRQRLAGQATVKRRLDLGEQAEEVDAQE